MPNSPASPSFWPENSETLPDANFRRSLSREAEFIVLGARTELSGARRARFDELLSSNELNWMRVLKDCEGHRLLGLVGRHLSARSWRDVPRPIALGWGRSFGPMTLHSAALAEELARVSKSLEEAGVPVVGFKGPTLAWSAYGNGAVRPFADLDVLVSRARVRRAHEALRALGYGHEARLSPAQERAHLRVDSVFNLSRPAPEALQGLFPGGFALELHWAITSPCLPFDLTFEDVAPRLDWMQISGTSCRVRSLAPSDLLLILCVHGAKHLWERLIWLCDLAQLLAHTPGLDWDATLRAASGRGIERMTALGLSLTRDVIGAPLPREVENWLSTQPEALRLASRLRARWGWPSANSGPNASLAWEEAIAGDDLEAHPAWETNWLLSQAIDHPWRRLGFFWHIATTPSALERQQTRLPPRLQSLWRLSSPLQTLRNRFASPEENR